MGPRAGPEEVWEKKISRCGQDMNPVLSNAELIFILSQLPNKANRACKIMIHASGFLEMKCWQAFINTYPAMVSS